MHSYERPDQTLENRSIDAFVDPFVDPVAGVVLDAADRALIASFGFDGDDDFEFTDEELDDEDEDTLVMPHPPVEDGH